MSSGSPNFSVGGVPLDPTRVNKPFLRTMYKAARAAKGTEISAADQKAGLAAIEELGKTGEMSKESLAALDTFTKSVKKEWKADKGKMWDVYNANGRDWSNAAVKKAKAKAKKEMAITSPFLAASQKFETELREATALAATQAIAGASFTPLAVVAGYEAYANNKKWNGTADKKTAAVVETFKAVQSGESHMITNGNKVQQVHREELWRALDNLTNEAKEAGEKGKPLPITAQYYELTSPEMIGNLAAAAKAGSKLRLNLDPGRLSYPSTDRKTGGKYFEVDDIPHKARTILQFANIKGADVGVSIFPMNRELGDPTDLMHRKVLRVGDKVLMSGMNANMGSGENLDAGYIIEGPAAAKYTENVRRDINTSSGSTVEDIWGEKHIQQFLEGDLRMGRRGITALLDTIGGPSKAGAELPEANSLEDLEKLARKAKVDLSSLFDIPEEDYEKTMNKIASGRGEVALSPEGKSQLLGVINKAVDATQSKKNIKALADIDLPSDKTVGKTRIDIGDLPAEREVLALNAIHKAEKFIYLPGFVVTRAIAGAIVAKQKEATANGKPLDIRIIADSGIYPDGGTPNSWGVDFLEDNGVPVRWSKLTRTDGHDRKIHAKQLLTDKGEIAGSTNFSKKGMQENWETSAYVHFDQSDKKSIALREQSKEQFETLWEDQTFDLGPTRLAAFNEKNTPKAGRDWAIGQGRRYATKQIIRNIQNYERESATYIQGLLERDDVSAKKAELLEQGYSEGDSSLMAAKDVLGKKAYLQGLHNLDSHKKLMFQKAMVEKWEARQKK